MIVQHDDRVILHRQRWERAEPGATMSASRTQAKSLQPNASSSVLAFGGNKDEHKSDDARSVNLKLASFNRSDCNSPNEPVTQRYSNATGEDGAGANIYS
jgi:hypothetical protein